MSKEQLDALIEKNYLTWVTYIGSLYPKYRSEVPDDIVNCYEYLIRRGVHDDIEDEDSLRSYFVNWVYKANFNFFDKKKQPPVDIDKIDLPQEEKEEIKDMRMQQVIDIVDKLSLEQQILYYSRYVDAMSVKAMSDKFKLKEKTIYAQLTALTKKIKSKL